MARCQPTPLWDPCFPGIQGSLVLLLPSLGQGALPFRGWRQQLPRWAPLVCPCRRRHPACARPCSGRGGQLHSRTPRRGGGRPLSMDGGGGRGARSVGGRGKEQSPGVSTGHEGGPGQDSSGRNLSLQRTGLLLRERARGHRWVLGIKDSAWDTFECGTCIRHPGRAAR